MASSHNFSLELRMSNRPVDMITVHRNSVGKNFEEVKRYFREEKKWETPAYHFWVNYDGVIKQWQSLTCNAWHAGPTWNPASAAIAVQGDFRQGKPTGAQMGALLGLMGTLCYAFDLVPTRFHSRAGVQVYEVNSHEELAAKENRVWKCPGENLDVSSLRRRTQKPDLPSLAGISMIDRVAFCGWF